MADDFEYVSHARLEDREGYRHAYLGEVPEPIVYGVQGVAKVSRVEMPEAMKTRLRELLIDVTRGTS